VGTVSHCGQIQQDTLKGRIGLQQGREQEATPPADVHHGLTGREIVDGTQGTRLLFGHRGPGLVEHRRVRRMRLEIGVHRHAKEVGKGAGAGVHTMQQMGPGPKERGMTEMDGILA
jgi:hypothetical protein